MNRPDCLVRQVCSKKGNGNSFISEKNQKIFFSGTNCSNNNYFRAVEETVVEEAEFFSNGIFAFKGIWT